MLQSNPVTKVSIFLLISFCWADHLAAQIPVDVFKFDTFQEIKDHHQALLETIPVIYELNPSDETNDQGQEIYMVPGISGVFWDYDRGQGANVTIRLRENMLIKPESDAMVSFMDLKSGSFRIEGPIGMPPSSLPEFRGFSRESGDGGFINMFSSGHKLELSGVYIRDVHTDQSDGNGGALNLQGGKITINGVWFDENMAKGNGGAIYSSGSSELKLLDSFLLENSAGGYGGGIFFSGEMLTVRRSVFSANIAGERGGNIEVQGGSKLTFKHNFGYDGVGSMIGDGFYFAPDSDTEFTIMNNIFLGASNCNSLRLRYGSLGDVSYNMVDNNRYGYDAFSFSGSGGLSWGNLFSSRTSNCPRQGSGTTDSRFNVDAGSSFCVSPEMSDIFASRMTSRISSSELNLSIADRIKLFGIVRTDLSKWVDNEVLQDRVPTFVWTPAPFQKQQHQTDKSQTLAEEVVEIGNCPLTDAVGLARPQDGDGNGTPACDAGPLEQQNGPDIGPGQSGAFFDINRNGEGIFVQMLDDTTAVVYVFSYTPQGEQMWLLGIGEVTGNSIYVRDMQLPEGPVFGPDYDPELLSFTDWGRMSVHWPSCAAPQNEPGVMTFQSRDDAYGKVRVFTGRLTQPVACEGSTQHEKVGWSGSYYLPEENGHGIVVEILPDGTVVMIWYMYDENGKQRWVLGTGQLVGNKVVITDIRMPTGAMWGNSFNPLDVVNNIWGSATLTFGSCSKMTVDYDSIQGVRSLELSRLTSLAGTACTP